MALYESVIITRPELSLSQVDSLISQLSEIITSNTGDIKKKEYWGLRTLAYKIKKNKKGHYSMINIDSEPSAIFEFERQMRINEDILRFLTIKIDKIDPNPSILNFNRNDSDEKYHGDKEKDKVLPKIEENNKEENNKEGETGDKV